MKSIWQKNLIAGLATVGLAVWAVGMTGCSSIKRTVMGHPDRTAGQVKDDERLESSVRDALLNSPAYKFPNARVAVYRGEVQLSGFVMTEQQKKEASRIAEDASSSARIQNDMLIRQNPWIPVVGETHPDQNNQNEPK